MKPAFLPCRRISRKANSPASMKPWGEHMKLRMQLAALLGTVLAVWAAYVAVLGPRIGWGPGVLVGVLGSLFLLVLVSASLGVFRAVHKVRLLSRGMSGPLEADGYSAWAGRVVAVGEPDRAPLSGEECVLWEYEMRETRGGADAREWSGIGQSPMGIESDHGTALIRCGVLPESLHWKRPKGDQVLKRAEALTERSDALRTSTPIDFVATLGALESLMDDEDGAARVDWRRGPEGPAKGLKGFREKRLELGMSATVFGWYSLADRAFVPNRRGLELMAGTPATLKRNLVRGQLVLLGIAVVANLLIQGLAVLSYVRAPQ